MNHKWGRVIGPAAHREWHWHVAQSSSRCTAALSGSHGRTGSLVKSLSGLWPLSLVASDTCNKEKSSYLPTSMGSVKSWYLALETGKFWFPAQVYNREGGHAGFLLSCYDAELCYDPCTDKFHARYQPHGNRAVAVESGVSWDRLRVPPIDTLPHHLHISDCLSELRPGDHVEVQWRRKEEFLYSRYS